ncbi:MAG: GIY-YIG nuclease family protein [Bacteroidales bacterium]
MGKIYLLQVADFFKIGYTKNNVHDRVRQLQTGCPDQITIKHIFETKHKMKIERTLHRIYAHNRVSGEFFELSYEDVSSFMSICEKYEKSLDILESNKNII